MLTCKKAVRQKEMWPQKCMVWKAIHKYGEIILKFVEGYLNSVKYYEILFKFYLKYCYNYTFTWFKQNNAFILLSRLDTFLRPIK